MVAVEIALVIIIVATITAGASVWGANRAKKIQALNDPGRKLAQAVRLLDQVRQADDILTALPSALSDDVRTFLKAYYKGELSP